MITDLSKAVVNLNHELLLPKLKACGLDNSVTFMGSFLTSRPQHFKIINYLSKWEKVFAGVPRFILGPLLFNIYINDIFLFFQECDLANYADASTMYISNKRISSIINSSSYDFTALSKWFYNNFMVFNPDNCY